MRRPAYDSFRSTRFTPIGNQMPPSNAVMPSWFSSWLTRSKLRSSVNRVKMRRTTSAWYGSISRWAVAGL